MHFAYSPRKGSNPSPYLPRAPILPLLRRNRPRVLTTIALVLVGLLFLNRSDSKGVERKPTGSPPVVIVTVFDRERFGAEYLETVKENRIQYAEKHGYATFFPKVGDYELNGAPTSWTKVVGVRHAISLYPDCYYIWYLDADVLTMNPSLTLEEHVMNPARLEGLMIKDQPVVPPDSIIKTFTHLKGQDVDLVITQDKEGISTSSFIIRNGEWARFFVETWFDPIYRSYNFQKAETHAMEHIVQWHPTILAKLALVDQRVINSYSKGKQGSEYKDGDIAIRFIGCTKSGSSSCESESQRFTHQWRTSLKNA